MRSGTSWFFFRISRADDLHSSHGLSYTTFEYSDLKVSDASIANGDVTAKATLTLKNTGSVAGAEVVQLYVSWPGTSALIHPPHTLKAFKKVVLGPGQSSTVELALDKYAVSSWYERLNCWVVEKGTYTLSVGGASDRLSLSASLDVPQVLEWKGL